MRCCWQIVQTRRATDDWRAEQTVGAGMCQEREHLLPLAEEGFDLAAVHFPM